MSKRPMIVAALVSAALSYVGAAKATDEAPTQAQCADAYDASQRLSQAGKLKSALEQLIVCAQTTCPRFLSQECTATFERVKLNLPTVTLVATDAQGSPLVDVIVTVDGQRVTEHIEGLATPVDPGLHEFVFEHAGDPPVTVKVLISEGEKNKPVVAAFGRQPAPTESTATAPSPPVDSTRPAQKTSSGVPIATYVLGGVGVAALGVGVAFRLIGAADYDALEKDCKTTCAPSQVDPVKTKYTISTVSLGVGAAALVTAGVFFLVDRASHKAELASRHRLQVQPIYLAGGGAAGMIQGAF